ncbi:MAG: cobaltochelatase subunit CobN, partial [Desulfarculaceae bacterium]
MKPVRVAIFAAGGMGLGSISRAYGRLSEEHPGSLELLARSSEDLFDQKQINRFLEALPSYHQLIIILHGGKTSCTFFDEMIQAAQGLKIFIHPNDEEALELSQSLTSDFGSDAYTETVLYLKYGGRENWFNLFSRLAAEAGHDLPWEEPIPTPCQSLYHPRLGRVETLEEYLRGLGYSGEQLTQGEKPVIGLWFGQHYYLESNLEPMDQTVLEIERQGCIPICCFYRRYPDPALDTRGTKWVMDNYFRIKGQTVIDTLLSTMMFSLKLTVPEEAELLRELDVPVLQAMQLLSNRQFWEETDQAVQPMDVSISVAQPEFDGILITVPISTKEVGERDAYTGAVVPRMVPITERIQKIVRLAKNWAQLRHKPNAKKRVAIVFHNYPPRNDRIGCAYGLDSFASVSGLLARLQEEGYQVDETYADPQELADLMVGSLTVDQRWLTPEAMAQRAASLAGPEQLGPWLQGIPQKNQVHMAEDWGQSPGELFVHEGQVMINGLINGNIYLGIQPPRGFIEQPEKIHDPYMSPSWHYLYYYRWIRDVFEADAVMHIGKHGSLEWLPGKSVGLSGRCYPDLSIMDMPHIYPYIINDPGEGTQAKRRSYTTIIDHLIPVMTNADTYEELAEVDNRLLDYMQTKSMNPTRLPVAQKEIWEAVEKANLHQDLAISQEEALADFDGFLEQLHSYLSECADTAIAEGLHTFGQPPQGEGLVELATQLVRLKNGNVPSLREAIAEHWGYNYDTMLSKRGQADPTGRYPTYAKALEAVHDACRQTVEALIEDQEPPLSDASEQIKQTVQFLHQTVLPKIEDSRQEIEAAVAALEGRYVAPGGSGAPTRGMVDILPTGRNFYSVDPYKIPAPPAWRVGVSLGDDLVERNIKETGMPPDNVGMVIWGSPTMRTQGEDIAEALYLMGLRPVWNQRNGRVEGLEVIPLHDLKFPRVDITFRTSGFFRDSFPNLMEMLDKGVHMVSTLKEPPDKNFLRRNVIREVKDLEKQGLTPEKAVREATFRVFSDPPGVYGAGVAAAIDAKAWETSDDLGDVWVTWGGYAYGENVYGTDQRHGLRRRLKDINLVVKNEDSREYDLLSSDDFNAYFGGFVAAVKMASGIQPRAYSGDA